MDVVIHPGMHKTGSSSIQATLAKNDIDGYALYKAATGNFSLSMAYIFEPKPEELPQLLARGKTKADIAHERNAKKRHLEDAITTARENSQSLILSGERISSSSGKAIKALAEFCSAHGLTPRVKAYVRRPVSFMQSALQQRLKGTDKDILHNWILWPNYRFRFEKLDAVFGRENVDIRIFERKRLADGDVVVDFTSWLGSPIEKSSVIRRNESLSLVAIAFLYAQRHSGQGFVAGSADALNLDAAFVKSLARIKGKKLCLSRAFLSPIVQSSAADLEWMETRLGEPLLDMPDVDDPDAVSFGEDLLRVAEQNFEIVEELLISQLRETSSDRRERLALQLDLLKSLQG